MKVREAIARTYPDVYLGKGLLRGLHPFYRAHPEAFPYRGVADAIASLRWPSRLSVVGKAYDAISTDWTEEAQGLTHDGHYWYVAAASRIVRIPLDRDWRTWATGDGKHVVVPRGVASSYTYAADFPTALRGYSHFGSLNYCDGFVYVPVTEPFEYTDDDGEPAKGSDSELVLAIFSTDLALVGSFRLKNEYGGAWCAVRSVDRASALAGNTLPRTTLLYTFPWEGDTLHIHELHRDGTGRWSAHYLGPFQLHGSRLPLRHIQGGAFSPTGHLYLVSDDYISFTVTLFWADLELRFPGPGAGIHGIDLLTGRQRLFTWIPIDPGRSVGEEHEGISVTDDGRVYVLMLDNDWDVFGPDEITLFEAHAPEGEAPHV